MPVEVNQDQLFSTFSFLSFQFLSCQFTYALWGWGETVAYTSIICLFLGDDGIDEFKKPGSTSSRSSTKNPTEATSQEQLLRERFRIYFPTDHTVSKSRGGRNVSCDPRVIYTAGPTNPVSFTHLHGSANQSCAISNHISFCNRPLINVKMTRTQAGGTICVQAKWWRSPNFPRELVRDVISRDRLLMHSKMIFVRRRVGDSQAIRQSPGWAYVGSANLSESAW